VIARTRGYPNGVARAGRAAIIRAGQLMAGTVSLVVTAGPIRGQRFDFSQHDTFLFGRAPDCHAGSPQATPRPRATTSCSRSTRRWRACATSAASTAPT
jgi:hypothetical protein